MSVIGIVACVAFFVLIAAREVAAQRADARASGWARLSRRYPAGGRSGGKPCPADVRVNGRWYRATAVTVGGAGVGLSLRPPLARAGHRPVSVPWDDVTAADSADGEVTLAAGDAAVVILTGAAAAAAGRMLERLGIPAGHAPVPSPGTSGEG